MAGIYLLKKKQEEGEDQEDRMDHRGRTSPS